MSIWVREKECEHLASQGLSGAKELGGSSKSRNPLSAETLKARVPRCLAQSEGVLSPLHARSACPATMALECQSTG